jgi:hypothetical protein
MQWCLYFCDSSRDTFLSPDSIINAASLLLVDVHRGKSVFHYLCFVRLGSPEGYSQECQCNVICKPCIYTSEKTPAASIYRLKMHLEITDTLFFKCCETHISLTLTHELIAVSMSTSSSTCWSSTQAESLPLRGIQICRKID